MVIEQPYFMNDESWYYFDLNDKKYKLTEKAPKSAIVSYKQFYQLLDGEN